MLDALIPPEINIYLEELSEPTPVLHSSHDVQIEFRVPACPVVSHFASTYVSELTYESCPVTVSSEEAATVRAPRKTLKATVNGKKTTLESCIRSRDPLPRLKVHWTGDNAISGEEGPIVFIQTVVADGHLGPLPSLSRMSDGTAYRSAHLDPKLAMAKAWRDAWELADWLNNPRPTGVKP